MTNPGNQANSEGDLLNWGLSATDSANNPILYSATNLPPGLTIARATGVISGTPFPGDSANSPYAVTVTAADSVNPAIADTQSLQWTVEPSVTLANPGTQTNAVGDTVYLPLAARDSAGNALTFNAVNLPMGLFLNFNTGTISGTIGSSFGTPFSATLTATDSVHTSTSASQTFQWTVGTATALAVTLANPGNRSDVEGSTVSFTLAAADSASNALIYSATNLPSGISIASTTGVISGTINAGDSHWSNTVVVTAADAMRPTIGATQTFTWAPEPSLNLVNPGSQSNAVGDTIFLPLAATDSAGNRITFSSTVIHPLPAGLNLDSASGVISGTISTMASLGSPYSVTVTASDPCCMGSVSQTFQWTVSAGNSTTVAMDNPGNQTNAEGDIVSLSLSATDSATNGMTFRALGLPPGLAIVAGTGVISGTINAQDSVFGPFSVTVSAVDNANESIGQSQTFQWTVHPSLGLDNIAAQSNAVGDTVFLPVSATNSAVNTLSFAATGLPAGLTIDATTGAISGTLASTAAASSPYFVTVTATDTVDVSALACRTFQWSVSSAGTVSVTLGGPGTMTFAEGTTVTIDVNAIDSAGHAVIFSAANLPQGIIIAADTGVVSGTLETRASANSPYTFTLTVLDSVNNTVGVSQTFQWNVCPATMLSNPGNQSNAVGDTIYLTLHGSDSAANPFNYGATGLPPGLTVDPITGAISGVPATGANLSSPYAVSVTATDTVDGTAGVVQSLLWSVGTTGTVAVSLANPGSQNNADGDNVSLTLTATDSGANVLTYAATGLLPGLTIDGSTGQVSGTIGADADKAGPYTVMVSATDSVNPSIGAGQAFLWNVSYAVAAASAADASFTVMHDHTLTVAAPGVLGGATNPDNASLTANLITGPSHGTLTLSSNGSFSYVPNSGFAGTDTFTFSANNGAQNGSSAEVFLFVSNNAPITADSNFATAAGQTLNVPASNGLLTGAYDADGDGLTVQLATGPVHGSLTLNSNGSFTYDPDSGFAGNDSFTYRASDGLAVSAASKATVSVVGLDAIANDDEYDTTKNQTLTVASPGILENDYAPATESISAVLDTGPVHGTLSLNANGSFTYVSGSSYTGQDSFTYTLESGGIAVGGPAQVRINVVNLTLVMPNGNWVILNANDDNASPVSNMVPNVRDYNYQRPLPEVNDRQNSDPDLDPLNINLTGQPVAGWLILNVQRAQGATGNIRLWGDQHKVRQLVPGLYPVNGANSLPDTIYVEGIAPTSSANGHSAPTPDITITVTYWLSVFVQLNATIDVGVGPVVQSHSVYTTGSRVGFVRNQNIVNGFTTLPGSVANSVFAARFNSQVYIGTVSAIGFNPLQYIQNLSVTNGLGGSFGLAGNRAAQNWQFQDGSLQPLTTVVDTAFQDPPPFFRSTTANPSAPFDTVQISSGDSPRWLLDQLVAIGLNIRNPVSGDIDVTLLDRVNFSLRFTLFLSWGQEACLGTNPVQPRGGNTVYYPLATRTWQVTVALDKNASSVVNRILPGSSISAQGSFALTDPNNLPTVVVSPPTANTGGRIV